MKKIFLVINILLVILYLSNCSDESSLIESSPELNITLRMEVQMRDSLYNLYPVPFTKMYFHTFIITPDGNITNEEFSDTTTCRNGWALKS